MQQDSPGETSAQPVVHTPWQRTAAFGIVALVIAGVVVFQQIAAVVPAGGDNANARAANLVALKQADAAARYAVFMSGLFQQLGAAAQQKQFAKQMAQSLEGIAADYDDARLYRRAGIVGMWLDGSPQRYENFEHAIGLQQSIDAERGEAERALWAVLYGAKQLEPLTNEKWEALQPVLAQLELDNWYLDIVRLRAANLLDQTDRASRLEKEIYAATQRRMLPLVLLAVCVIAGTVIGFVGGIVLLALFIQGYFVPAGIKRGLPARPLWETVIIYLSLVGGLSAAFGAVAQGLHWSPGPMEGVALSLSIQLLSLGSVLWLKIARPRVVLSDLGWHLRRALGDVLSGIAGYLVALPVLGLTLVAAALLQRLLPGVPAPSHPAMERLIGQPLSVPVMIGIFVMVSVMAPLVEELIFRGVLQSALRQRMSAAGAICTSALLFAAVHPQGPLGLPTLFVLGALFAALREIRGSLLPGMVAHGINNAVALAALLLMMD